eukprot:5701921-Amphidinium_carterae.1
MKLDMTTSSADEFTMMDGSGNPSRASHAFHRVHFARYLCNVAGCTCTRRSVSRSFSFTGPSTSRSFPRLGPSPG